MKYGKQLFSPIHWAISSGQLPEDIAGQIRISLDVFKENTALFDSENLQGPAKQAELMIKLGFWLVRGQLKEHEFRIWAQCVPPADNQGWDVDLLQSEPGSPIQPILKMGPLFSNPEACLIQEPQHSFPVLQA
jgi:hypothetical protein